MAAIAGGVAVIPSAPISVRSNDVEYVYRQDNDFYYLTGFAEPESVAVFAPGNKDGEYILFVRPRDRERETWTGKRAGVEGAVAEFGADRAYKIDELDRVLPEILARVESIYYPLGNNEPMNQRMVGWLRQCQAMRPRSGAGANSLLDPREILHEMRLFKQPEELEVMRRAFEATVEDPQFRADATKIQAELAPTTGERVQKLVGRIYATPRSVIERVKKLFTP